MTEMKNEDASLLEINTPLIDMLFITEYTGMIG